MSDISKSTMGKQSPVGKQSPTGKQSPVGKQTGSRSSSKSKSATDKNAKGRMVEENVQAPGSRSPSNTKTDLTPGSQSPMTRAETDNNSSVPGSSSPSSIGEAMTSKAVLDVLKCDPLRCVPTNEMMAMMKCNPISCMPNGCVQPEQYYACDREVAKSLAQYLSLDERKKVQAWLVTLEQMTLDEDELSERFMYMTCLVMLLKFGNLVPPFTRFPPARPLRSLRDHIDRHLFKKVQIECRKRRVDEWDQYEQPNRSVTQRPTEFFSQMPTPNNGIFCYGVAFSTM